MWGNDCYLSLLWQTFHSILLYKIMLYILSLYNIMYQLYINKFENDKSLSSQSYTFSSSYVWMWEVDH